MLACFRRLSAAVTLVEQIAGGKQETDGRQDSCKQKTVSECRSAGVQQGCRSLRNPDISETNAQLDSSGAHVLVTNLGGIQRYVNCHVHRQLASRLSSSAKSHLPNFKRIPDVKDT
jgi:hypothetical protein